MFKQMIHNHPCLHRKTTWCRFADIAHTLTKRISRHTLVALEKPESACEVTGQHTENMVTTGRFTNTLAQFLDSSKV